MSMEFSKEYRQEDEDYGHMEIECDDCGNEDGEDGSFRECIRNLKNKGWEFKYHGKDDFTHRCPDRSCKRKRTGPKRIKLKQKEKHSRDDEGEKKSRRSRRRRKNEN